MFNEIKVKFDFKFGFKVFFFIFFIAIIFWPIWSFISDMMEFESFGFFESLFFSLPFSTILLITSGWLPSPTRTLKDYQKEVSCIIESKDEEISIQSLRITELENRNKQLIDQKLAVEKQLSASHSQISELNLKISMIDSYEGRFRETKTELEKYQDRFMKEQRAKEHLEQEILELKKVLECKNGTSTS